MPCSALLRGRFLLAPRSNMPLAPSSSCRRSSPIAGSLLVPAARPYGRPPLLFIHSRRTALPSLLCPRPPPLLRASGSAGVAAAMKDRLTGGYGSTVCVPPPAPRLRSVIGSTSGTLSSSTSASRSLEYDDWRGSQGLVLKPAGGEDVFGYFRQPSSSYGRFAFDDYSDEDSDREIETSSNAANKGSSTLDNVDEWKWKLSMLLRNEDEQEVISRERKDRRDYEQLAALASRLGLYSRQYSKVVVFSKLPLPNYRPDLDDKRPQREVSLPIGLHREIDVLLAKYISRKRTNQENFPSTAFSRSSSTDSFAADEGLFEQQESQTSSSAVMERILRRRSLQLRNQQQAWQESPEGQRMLEFRRSLPSYKEKDALLAAISENQLAESAKSQFSCRDYSDHLALVRAYEGWKDAEREQSGYEYCWRNFLSAQTLRAIDSLRKQFLFLLRDAGLVDDNSSMCNRWSRDENIVRAVICSGLYPGICSVVNKEKSISLKTMEDGQVMLYSNSVNGKEAKIPYPWLVFNEKVKVNSVFLRESTAISDSILLLFGGRISRGGLDGHLKMLGGYLEFFMKPDLGETYLKLKRELDELVLHKLLNPKMDIGASEDLLSAVRLLVAEDPCSGRFVFGRQELKPVKSRPALPGSSGGGGDNPKSQLQTLVTRAGHSAPSYTTKQMKNSQFRATVEFNGMQFVGQPCSNKKLAEKDAATEAVEWLMGGAPSGSRDVDHLSMLLKRNKKKNHRRI